MARGRGRSITRAYGFGLTATGPTYSRTPATEGATVRLADGSTVPAYRQLTPDEVRARDEKVVRDFREKRDELIARGFLPSTDP